MDERINKLSPDHSKILHKFKANVSDVELPAAFEDIDYYRFLKARQFDIKKAEYMLRQHLIWRKEIDLENIAKWKKPEAFVKYYPGGFYGFTKEGNPLYYIMQGYLDIKGMHYSVRKKDIVKSVIQDLEHCTHTVYPTQSKKMGRNIDQSILIVDMEGFGLKHLWKPYIDCLHEVLTAMDLNYPERLRRCYVINVNWMFSIIWNITKPLMSEDTKSKMIITGSDWKSELLKFIDPDQLPAAYGGTATDPDGNPRCETGLCWGGPIPDEYKNRKPDIDLSKFTSLTVGRHSSHQVDVMVDTPGSVLSWQYWTEAKDIGFGVYRRTAGARQHKGDMEEIVKSERVNSHIVPEDGRITCDHTGTYQYFSVNFFFDVADVVRFDNTYSWVNSKRVSYFIEIYEPEESADN